MPCESYEIAKREGAVHAILHHPDLGYLEWPKGAYGERRFTQIEGQAFFGTMGMLADVIRGNFEEDEFPLVEVIPVEL